MSTNRETETQRIHHFRALVEEFRLGTPRTVEEARYMTAVLETMATRESTSTPPPFHTPTDLSSVPSVSPPSPSSIITSISLPTTPVQAPSHASTITSIPPPRPNIQGPPPFSSVSYSILSPLELAQPYPYFQKLCDVYRSGYFQDFKEEVIDRGYDMESHERWMVTFQAIIPGRRGSVRQYATRVGHLMEVTRERAAKSFLVSCVGSQW